MGLFIEQDNAVAAGRVIDTLARHPAGLTLPELTQDTGLEESIVGEALSHSMGKSIRFIKESDESPERFIHFNTYRTEQVLRMLSSGGIFSITVSSAGEITNSEFQEGLEEFQKNIANEVESSIITSRLEDESVFYERTKVPEGGFQHTFIIHHLDETPDNALTSKSGQFPFLKRAIERVVSNSDTWEEPKGKAEVKLDTTPYDQYITANGFNDVRAFEEAKNGNPYAQEVLDIRTRFTLIYYLKWLRKELPHLTDANVDDIVQHCFEKRIENIANGQLKLESLPQYKRWLYTVAHNKAVDLGRLHESYSTSLNDLEEKYYPVNEMNGNSLSFYVQLRPIIIQKVKLSPLEQQVLDLRMQDFRYEQIVRILHTTRPSVKQAFYRATQAVIKWASENRELVRELVSY